MILETGTIVFFSLIVLFWRLSPRTRLWILGHPLWLEVPFGLAAYVLHYGTFSGMMSAATAVAMCYAYVQLMRWAVGYLRDGAYHPGHIRSTP